MCENCECGEHTNTQNTTEQDLALQFRVDTGYSPNQKPYQYKVWLEKKVLNQQNYQNTIEKGNNEINKVITDELGDNG